MLGMGNKRNTPGLMVGAFSNLPFYKINQQHMQAASHPQASIVHPQSSSTGLEHPQLKVSSIFAFCLRSDFLAVSFFDPYFLILAMVNLLYTVPSTITTSLNHYMGFFKIWFGYQWGKGKEKAQVEWLGFFL